MASQTAKTASTWYQTKRIPLYLVVGGTFASAVTFLSYNRSQHPQVESHKDVRQNEMHEVEPGGPMSEHVNRGAGHGATTQTSGVRAGLRNTGMMDGQSTHGIMPNEAIANKLREYVGPEHKEHEEILANKK